MKKHFTFSCLEADNLDDTLELATQVKRDSEISTKDGYSPEKPYTKQTLVVGNEKKLQEDHEWRESIKRREDGETFQLLQTSKKGLELWQNKYGDGQRNIDIERIAQILFIESIECGWNGHQLGQNRDIKIKGVSPTNEHLANEIARRKNLQLMIYS